VPGVNRFLALVLGSSLALALWTLWIPNDWSVSLVHAVIAIAAMVLAARGELRRPPAAVLALGLVVGVGLLQLALGRTAYRWDTEGDLIGYIFAAALVYVVATLAGEPSLRHQAATALVWFGVVVASVSIVQQLVPYEKLARLTPNPNLVPLYGPFASRNRFAMFVELCLPVAVWRAATGQGMRYVWMAGILFASAVGGASRAGFLVLTLELGAVLWLAYRHGAADNRRLLRAGTQLVLAIALAGAVAGWGYLAQRLETSTQGDSIRANFYRSTLAMMADYPWTGVGLGAWPMVYPEYARFDNGLLANQAHSDWLQWPAEGGPVMLAAMLALAWFNLRGGVRSPWTLGGFAVFVHALVDFPFHGAPAFHLFTFAVMGLVVSAERQEKDVTERRRARGLAQSAAVHAS